MRQKERLDSADGMNKAALDADGQWGQKLVSLTDCLIRSPASNKKGGRECRQGKDGTYASKMLDSPANTSPLQAVSMTWAPFTNCQKKGGSLIPPRTTHRPLTEGNEPKMTEEIPTSRRHHDKTSLV